MYFDQCQCDLQTMTNRSMNKPKKICAVSWHCGRSRVITTTSGAVLVVVAAVSVPARISTKKTVHDSVDNVYGKPKTE